jgi:hypothetical protein
MNLDEYIDADDKLNAAFDTMLELKEAVSDKKVTMPLEAIMENIARSKLILANIPRDD